VAVRPARHGEFGLYAGGRWHRLALRTDLAEVADPARHLDVSLLTDHVLAPLLGIGDLRTDARVDFVGGGRGLAELERRVDSGAMAAAFSLYPTDGRPDGGRDADEVMLPNHLVRSCRRRPGLARSPRVCGGHPGQARKRNAMTLMCRRRGAAGEAVTAAIPS
jgi:hypothetical protein